MDLKKLIPLYGHGLEDYRGVLNHLWEQGERNFREVNL
jgi:hypothetical protein